MTNKGDYQSDKRSGNWEPDPYHRHDQRWWSGNRWSEKVRSNEETRIDPPGVITNPVHRDSQTGPAEPILDSPLPMRHISRYIPHMLLLGGMIFVATLCLALISVFS